MKLILTFACTLCHRGWPMEKSSRWPKCPRCGNVLKVRGWYFAVDLGQLPEDQDH